MQNEIENTWKLIMDWASQHFPAVAEDLNTPLKFDGDRSLNDIEKKGGFEIPAVIKHFMTLHHGQKDPNTSGLFFGMQLLREDDIFEEWDLWLDFSEDNERLSSTMSSFPEKVIKPLYCNKLWIPITKDGAGNYIGMDLDPDVNGTRGQIIIFGRDENEKKLIADSLADFLSIFYKQLMRFGKYNKNINGIDYHDGNNIHYHERFSSENRADTLSLLEQHSRRNFLGKLAFFNKKRD